MVVVASAFQPESQGVGVLEQTLRPSLRVVYDGVELGWIVLSRSWEQALRTRGWTLVGPDRCGASRELSRTL